MPSLRRFVLVAGLVFCGPLGAGAPDSAELQTLKAAYICHFILLTRWPAPASPVVVGVYGHSPDGDQVAATLPRAVGNVALKVVRIPQDAKEWGPLNVVYIPSAYQAEVPALLRRLGPAPVLTIGDSAPFAEEGGVIGFFMEDGRLRFKINQGAAEKKGLTLGAKLLELAKPHGR